MKEEEFQNPIDPDLVVENPGLMTYAHNIASALIHPLDEGRIKGRALKAMAQQTEMQMDQIRQQIELLAQQARKIKDRVEVSAKIYQAAVGFEPLIGDIYHLYEKKDGSWRLSLVGPDEWGASIPFAAFISSVKLLADHTWEMLDHSE